ncbi:MAG: hypothetical protein NTX53_18570, partial [candidate division WOR-3 bacterium]|nr:hypothetical protein [candidate division WOR-3 bacterium]
VYYTPTYIVDYIVKNTVGKSRKGGPPAHLTNVRCHLKMQPMPAQGRPALTGMELIIMSPELPKMQPMPAQGRPALTGMELIIMSPELPGITGV